MAIQFNKHAEEANLFIKELAKTLGQPNEFGRTGILLQSVMHTLRECISVKASIDLIDELPMFLKGLYVDNWKYGEFSGKIHTLEEFKNKVKEKQDRYGEMEFPHRPAEQFPHAGLHRHVMLLLHLFQG